MNTDFRYYLFSDHFKFSRQEAKDKKSQGGKTLKHERKRAKQPTSDTQCGVSYSIMFLFNTSNVSLLRLPAQSITCF